MRTMVLLSVFLVLPILCFLAPSGYGEEIPWKYEKRLSDLEKRVDALEKQAGIKTVVGETGTPVTTTTTTQIAAPQTVKQYRQVCSADGRSCWMELVDVPVNAVTQKTAAFTTVQSGPVMVTETFTGVGVAVEGGGGFFASSASGGGGGLFGAFRRNKGPFRALLFGR